MQNDNVVLVVGRSTMGKTTSLMGLRDPEGVMYLNCEAGKRLTFPAKFKQYTITDPYQVFEAIQHAETLPEIHTIVVDSITYLLDLYETVYVTPAEDTRAAWGNFFSFMKQLMHVHVAGSSKKFVFTAHVLEVMNTAESILEVRIPVKGALKNNGINTSVPPHRNMWAITL